MNLCKWQVQILFIFDRVRPCTHHLKSHFFIKRQGFISIEIGERGENLMNCLRMVVSYGVVI